MIQIVLFAALMIVIVAAIFLAAKVMNKIEPGKDREA